MLFVMLTLDIHAKLRNTFRLLKVANLYLIKIILFHPITILIRFDCIFPRIDFFNTICILFLELSLFRFQDPIHFCRHVVWQISKNVQQCLMRQFTHFHLERGPFKMYSTAQHIVHLENKIKLVRGKEPLRIVRIDEKAQLPVRKSAGAAGFDLYSSAAAIIPAGQCAKMSTGLKMQIPRGYYGKIESRSSLVLQDLAVQAGVIDSDYRGEVLVILRNYGTQDAFLEAGERIAQIVLVAIGTPNVLEVEMLDSTQRGEGGFGSTGKK